MQADFGKKREILERKKAAFSVFRRSGRGDEDERHGFPNRQMTAGRAFTLGCGKQCVDCSTQMTLVHENVFHATSCQAQM
jgi:hypothetical protein